MDPDWLPPRLVLSGTSLTDDYESLYAVFEADLKNQSLRIESLPVMIDMGPDGHMTQYERGFTHLVTKQDGAGLRTIDYDRAAKICWVKPVIENYKAPEVNSFWYAHADGDVLYLWLPDHDFVVILKPLKGSGVQGRVIVTAYHIESYRKKSFQNKYGNAKRIL